MSFVAQSYAFIWPTDMEPKEAEGNPSLMDVLTSRQFAVTTLVASGLSNREIAKLLRISEHTVSHHLNNIFDRSGCGNRTELAARCVHEQDQGLYRKKRV